MLQLLCRPFAQRYSMLLTSGKGAYQPLDMNLSNEDAADLCRRILQATKAEAWQLGRSRVFLRAGQLALLEVRKAAHLYFLEPCIHTSKYVDVQVQYSGLEAEYMKVILAIALTTQTQ